MRLFPYFLESALYAVWEFLRN